MMEIFYKYYVFITCGILAVSFVSGVEILEKQVADLTFLDGALLNLTCQIQSSVDRSGDLKFLVNGNSNISAYSPKPSFDGGKSTLFIQKTVVVSDKGTYLCEFGSDSDSVQIHVFSETKEKSQKRFLKDSTDLTEGHTLELECPVLDKLKATVSWGRLDGTLKTHTLSPVGDETTNGKLSVEDMQTEDRGQYFCKATWYSGEATFTHLVRVKSKLAPLWPAIGIIAEILVLVAIVLLCKDRKKKGESQPLNAPSTSGNTSNEKGSRRKYATSST